MLRIRQTLRIMILCFICVCSQFVLTASSENSISPKAIFDNFWQEAKSNIYPKELEDRFFTDAHYDTLNQKALVASDLYELTPAINNFLEKLEVSHTQFFDNHSIEFYLFRSMFLTRDISVPKVNHIGAQYVLRDSQYVVREVLEGYPAASAGLRRGDILVNANGKPFHPYRSFNPVGGNIALTVLRNKKNMSVNIDAVTENPNFSFYNAMIESVQIYEIGKRKVGYLHLWSGTHENILQTFKDIIEKEFHNMDGIILDLRGGFGGAWYDYLDPFFPDRSDFFEYTWIDRDGGSEVHKPESKTNTIHYSGPMVVLINEGVRSGKEALAYQFKKSHRAILIGTQTQGAFTAGRGIFNEEHLPYFLFLSTAELLLDGTTVEGVGISPDIYVPYPLHENISEDPQLQSALATISESMNNTK